MCEKGEGGRDDWRGKVSGKGLGGMLEFGEMGWDTGMIVEMVKYGKGMLEEVGKGRYVKSWSKRGKERGVGYGGKERTWWGGGCGGKKWRGA